jgi:hypothetical protein
MPPSTFGVVFVVQSSRPGSTRSGDIARKKPSPAVSPEPCSAAGRRLDDREVGLALPREWRRQRDQDRVGLAHVGVRGRRTDETLLDERCEPRALDVLDVAFAPVQRVDDVPYDVDDEHPAAGLGKGRRERQADIARADDGDVVAHDRATLAA